MVYLDDIIMCCNAKADHFTKVREILTILTNAGIFLKLKIASFLRKPRIILANSCELASSGLPIKNGSLPRVERTPHPNRAQIFSRSVQRLQTLLSELPKDYGFAERHATQWMRGGDNTVSQRADRSI